MVFWIGTERFPTVSASELHFQLLLYIVQIEESAKMAFGLTVQKELKFIRPLVCSDSTYSTATRCQYTMCPVIISLQWQQLLCFGSWDIANLKIAHSRVSMYWHTCFSLKQPEMWYMLLLFITQYTCDMNIRRLIRNKKNLKWNI